jgi:hypothetical protein
MAKDEDRVATNQPLLRPWASWLTIALLVAAAVVVLWRSSGPS